MDLIFKALIKEIKKCHYSNDVPVAALILDKKNKIVFKSHNTRQKKYIFTDHAEIKIINKLYKKIKTKNMKDYKIVVSLKPCLMCLTIIEQANIKNVIYYLENVKCDYKNIKFNINFINEGSEKEKLILKQKLKDFFIKLR